MTHVYMECTLFLLAQDNENSGTLQHILGASEHCSTKEGEIKYVKFTNETR